MNIEQKLKSAFEQQPTSPAPSTGFQDQVMAKVPAHATAQQSRSSRLLKAYWLIAALLFVAAISQVSWAATVDPTLLWVVGGAAVLTVGPVILLARLAGFSLLDLMWRTIDR